MPNHCCVKFTGSREIVAKASRSLLVLLMIPTAAYCRCHPTIRDMHTVTGSCLSRDMSSELARRGLELMLRAWELL